MARRLTSLGQGWIAGGPDGRHRLLDFVQARHAGGQDDGTALGCQVAQQREIGDLPRRHLEESDPEPVQDIGALLVEGRGEEREPARRGPVLQLRQHRRGELEPREHLTLALARSRGLDLVSRLGRATGQQGVDAKRLELDGVRPALGRGVHQAAGERRIAVVIHAGLGHDEDASARAEGGQARRGHDPLRAALISSASASTRSPRRPSTG